SESALRRRPGPAHGGALRRGAPSGPGKPKASRVAPPGRRAVRFAEGRVHLADRHRPGSARTCRRDERRRRLLGGTRLENLIPTLKSISEIIEDFRSETIAIPEIQRDVVWGAGQIKDLIDSITRGYPCGALIFWEPREKDKSVVKSMIRPERAANGD